MRPADARYELARLHELLGQLPQLLHAVGVRGDDAEDLAAAARQHDAQLRVARLVATAGAACASS